MVKIDATQTLDPTFALKQLKSIFFTASYGHYFKPHTYSYIKGFLLSILRSLAEITLSGLFQLPLEPQRT